MRWLLQCWAELIHGYAIEYVGPDRPVLPKGIEDRDADVWEPLLAIAELAGGHWPERARVAAVTAVTAAGVNAMPSEGMRLLWEIQAVFDRLKVGPSSRRTGGGVGPDRTAWRRLASKRLAQDGEQLRDNQSQFLALGTKVTRGYRRESFEDAWLRATCRQR